MPRREQGCEVQRAQEEALMRRQEARRCRSALGMKTLGFGDDATLHHLPSEGQG